MLKRCFETIDSNILSSESSIFRSSMSVDLMTIDACTVPLYYLREPKKNANTTKYKSKFISKPMEANTNVLIFKHIEKEL